MSKKIKSKTKARAKPKARKKRTLASATYSIALGDNTQATHQYSVIIGDGLKSIAEKHVWIRFGGVEIKNFIATNKEIIAIREAVAVLLAPEYDISKINKLAKAKLLKETEDASKN